MEITVIKETGWKDFPVLGLVSSDYLPRFQEKSREMCPDISFESLATFGAPDEKDAFAYALEFVERHPSYNGFCYLAINDERYLERDYRFKNN